MLTVPSSRAVRNIVVNKLYLEQYTINIQSGPAANPSWNVSLVHIKEKICCTPLTTFRALVEELKFRYDNSRRNVFIY